MGTTGNHVAIVRGKSPRITDIKKSYTTAMLARAKLCETVSIKKQGVRDLLPPPSGCWVFATGTGEGRHFQLWREFL